MKLNNAGLRGLTTDDEQSELEAIGTMPAKRPSMPIRLQYLKDSKKMMGIALWNVLSPKIEGYVYNVHSGLPTFSVDTLRKRGLI